jgi:hypothetical protein
MRVPPRTEIESFLPRQTEEASTCKLIEGEKEKGKGGMVQSKGERKPGGRGRREVAGVIVGEEAVRY